MTRRSEAQRAHAPIILTSEAHWPSVSKGVSQRRARPWERACAILCVVPVAFGLAFMAAALANLATGQ